MMYSKNKLFPILTMLCATGLPSCSKLVSVPEPINTVTTAEVFSTDAQANSAMAGVYTEMVNGANGVVLAPFSLALTPALSSDELAYGNLAGPDLLANKNQLTVFTAPTIWAILYGYIYGANAVIQGVQGSTSGLLHDSARKELIGEAKFVRAFAYFYLTNLYGDVPLALTIDFNQTQDLAKSSQAKVYGQIIQDLKDAQAALLTDYSAGNGERIRANKWAATAMLARVYLFSGDFADAATQAAAVIANSSQYSLVSDPAAVFAPDNNEAIWQLQQNSATGQFGNATAEGIAYLPNPLNTGFTSYGLSPQLIGAFEPGDRRWPAWVDSTDESYNTPVGVTPGIVYFPYKYKTGYYNYQLGGTPTEYYTVLRLAEQYLIRAEAEANGAAGGTPAAIADLNIIRQRAGLTPLSPTLTADQVVAAVAHERQIELFAEWGHRWLDLKRTGQAHAVLSQIPWKQPWAGDYQLLYPIPPKEIQYDPNLQQNPGY